MAGGAPGKATASRRPTRACFLLAPRLKARGRDRAPKSMHLETLAIHAGFDADPATRAVAVPIYQTASFAFDSADHAAALFDLEVDGYRYSRIGNPTNAV